MANTLEPGNELDGGKYRIVRLLGQGGMGSVFEAENTRTHKRVAVKCLHPAQAGDAAAAERMAREAQASARVRHPNVVDVYDVCRDANTVFLVMEYLEGEPLSHALARKDLPMHAAIALLLPAMRAVAAAHKQGVIHRDIKPDNIFLAREADAPGPVTKVLDFGISKLDAQHLGQQTLTRSGVTIGTPSYMSYEQLAGDKTIDGRTDVYAFGVVLYEALTGQMPYEADTLTELIIKLTSQPPAPPKELRHEIPNSLSRIVLWALAKDRDDRIPTMDALVHELEPFATEHGFRAEMTASGPTRVLVEGPSRRGRSQAASQEAPPRAPRLRGATAALLTCAVLAVLAVWLFARQATQRADAAAPIVPAAAPADVSARRSAVDPDAPGAGSKPPAPSATATAASVTAPPTEPAAALAETPHTSASSVSSPSAAHRATPARRTTARKATVTLDHDRGIY